MNDLEQTNMLQPLVDEIETAVSNAKKEIAEKVNSVITETYWKIGKYIVEFEQDGNVKAAYGSKLLTTLSHQLTLRLGRGYSRPNLNNMRKFYLCYENCQTVSDKLTWSHICELIKIDDELERSFYEKECYKEKWDVRTLRRQMDSALFLRLATSRDKEGILALAREGITYDKPEDVIKDTYTLEFLGLPEKERYSEEDLEQKIIDNLQKFLLELGKGFTFVGRQYPLTVNNIHYHVDLVFYHRILKCFVLIDLKKNSVQHIDIGQMNMYMGYFAKEENMADDNPPIGIILSHNKDELLVEYATYGMDSNLFVSKLSACQYDGKLVALPHHTDTIAMFYNKRMFEEAGIRIPTSVEDGYSWEEITDIARTLKEKYNLPYAFGGIWENNSGYRYLPFVYMNNGALLNEAQDTVTMDSPEVLEAIQLYENWRKEDLIANTAFSGASTTNSLFVAEQIAFTFSGSWHCSYMQENMGDKWGMTYMPMRNGKTGSDMGGNAMFAYAGTKYPKAAAIVVDYITNAENMKTFCETGSFIPVRTSLLEGGVEYKAFQDEMKILNEIVGTIDPKLAADETSVAFQQLNAVFNEEMDPLAVNNSATAEDVVAACQERMTEVLQEQ